MRLAVEAKGAGLIHRQRAAELTADLLQLLGIELAELFC
jgi:3,4-dihydroxy-2-butanone 4-phosphate synthase